MLKSEEQMELVVLKKHGDEHSGSVAVDGAVSQHGSAIFTRWRRGVQA